MNRIYRPICNDKTSASRFALKGLAVSLMLAFGSNVHALPTGGAVSAGSASIAGGAGTMTINQSSQNVAINWQSFNIGQTEAVRFAQPNSASVALNRVLGSDPSSIMGSLSANGKVFLVNPSGILFGKGAQVNVGGLVASTRNITDSDFMAGNYKFAGTGGGTILNQGSINADGGYVALLGANVSNEGVISARLGTVALAAGNAFTLDVAGDGLLNVAVNQGALDALVQNGGLIRADGGQVLLTALSAGNLLQSAVNNTGVIQAQTVENHNGTIRLLGDMQSGTVSVGGTLDASGTGAGQTGGSVTVTGHHVGLFGGHINASGDAGGGTVLVGGGYQGNNPAVQNASATYMSADSTISADAITNGNGGTVVLWANDSTRAYGSITARGGAQGGNGGLIETSAHWLDVWGINVNASAPNGKGGMWLLDPADVTISAAANSNGSVIAGVFAPNAGFATANVDSGALQVLLNAGTSVTITTTNIGVPGGGSGDITVNAALTWVPAATSTLTLNAARDVNIDAAISATNGNLVVCCGRDINVRAAITTDPGSVLLSAGRDINLFATPGAITVTNGNITMCAGHDVNVIGKITLTQSAGIVPALSLGLPRGLVLSAGNASTGPGAAGGGGTVILPIPGVPNGPSVTGTGPAPTPVIISYNPTSYLPGGATDYSGSLILVDAVLTQFMLVFPEVATKTFDNTTTATFTGLKGSPAGVTLNGVGPAFFNTAAAEVAPKLVTYNANDFSLTQAGFVAGGAGRNFALPTACCGVVTRTTGFITAAPVVVGPGIVPPVIVVAPADAVPISLVASLPFIQNSVGSVLPLEVPGLSLSVVDEGIRMPPIELAQTPPPVLPAPVVVPPVVVPPVAPPMIFVPPLLPPKPDRN